jgi:hypothetical protein
LAGAGRGWSMLAPAGGWRVGLLAIAFLAWIVVLVPWLVRCRTMTPAEHQRGMYAALAAWAVTDIAVAVGFGLG